MLELNQVQMRLPGNFETLLMLKSYILPVVLPSTETPWHQLTVIDVDSLENEGNVNLHQLLKTCLESCFFRGWREKTNLQGNQNTAKISSRAAARFALPFSSASVECILSYIIVVYTELRNSFSVRSVETILQIRFELSVGGMSYASLSSQRKIW